MHRMGEAQAEAYILLKITIAQKVRLERNFLTFLKNTKKVRSDRTILKDK